MPVSPIKRQRRLLWLSAILLLGCNSATKVEKTAAKVENTAAKVEAPPALIGVWSQVSPLERGPTETNRFTFNSNGTFRWKRFVIDEGRDETPSMTGTWIMNGDVIQLTVVETEKPTLMPVHSFDLQIIALSDSELELRDVRYDDETFKIGSRTFLDRVKE